MKKLFFPIFTVLLSLFFYACEQKASEKISEEGVRYIHHIQSKGIPIDSGNVIEMHLEIYTSKDSAIRNTRKEGPYPYAAPAIPNSPFKDLLFKVAEGDSLTVFVPLTDMMQGQQAPPFLANEKDLRCEVKIIKVYSNEEYRNVSMERMKEQQKKYQEELEKQKAEDIKLIEAHLKAENLLATAQKTNEGLYYIMKTEGSGELPTQGDTVSVHYAGTLLDGTEFDNSFKRGEPIQFALGVRQVIAGWDIGLGLLKKGGKATLYIPSVLAYGNQQRGNIIMPNSNLKFEVELVDIKKPQSN